MTLKQTFDILVSNMCFTPAPEPAHVPRRQRRRNQARLLAAATEVFAEVGYRAATLREICRRGQANIAAVNYHFRDKEHLYAAVVRQAVAAAGEGLARIDPNPADPPEEKLRHFIHGSWRTCWGWIARCCCCGWWPTK